MSYEDNVLFIYLHILNYIYRNYNIIYNEQNNFAYKYGKYHLSFKFENNVNPDDYLFLNIKIITPNIYWIPSDVICDDKIKNISIELTDSKYGLYSFFIFSSDFSGTIPSNSSSLAVSFKPFYEKNIDKYIKYLIQVDPIFYKEYLTYYDYFNFINLEEL